MHEAGPFVLTDVAVNSNTTNERRIRTRTVSTCQSINCRAYMRPRHLLSCSHAISQTIHQLSHKPISPSRLVTMSTVCELCHDLHRNGRTSRVVLECKPDELIQSAGINQCSSCDILLRGLRLMEDDSWSLEDALSLYGYGFRDHDTLIVEIHFKQDRPRIELEFYQADQCEGCESEALIFHKPFSQSI